MDIQLKKIMSNFSKYGEIAILAIVFITLFNLASGQSRTDIIAATLILEAGGENAKGAMEAVHEVICNRSSARRISKMDACLQYKQFSCWNSGELASLISKAKRHQKYAIAMSIVLAEPTNYTHGADHYHADYCLPYWADSMRFTTKIGRHIFYKSS